MQLHTFIAESAADAIAQIRTQLGPTAVVLNVRRQTEDGLSRFWKKPRIEVLAHVPQPSPIAIVPPTVPSDTLDEFRQKLSAIAQQVAANREAPASVAAPLLDPPPTTAPRTANFAPGQWRIAAALENSGILPIHAQRVVEELRARHGDIAPKQGMARELDLASQVLTEFWERKRPRVSPTATTHILIGAAGVGKTTCICKWLAEEVLLKSRRAAVWRLDGRIANTAEVLGVYCDILGVTVNRLVQDQIGTAEADICFIDLPGINWTDPEEVRELGRRLQTLPSAQVHLVLNGAYESPLLLAQARAFDALPITDVFVTHLDEETRWGKLWNLVLGTNYPLRFLSAGQNIPGDLSTATPQKLLQRQFLNK